MDTAVVEVRDLSKTYGATTAVDQLEFSVAPGKVTGFLGPNGAGKTTTIRLILGLIRPTKGQVRVLGVPYRELRHPTQRVGALIDGEGFHPNRTARQHLRNVAALAGLPDARVDEVIDLADLARAADRKVGGFSLGMRQRLGLAGALLGDPELLILDEPSNGLDPAGIRWVRGLLRSVADSGRTVFVSSHALAEMANLADEIVLIKKGRLITHTKTSNLLTGDEVVVRTSDPQRLLKALEGIGARVEHLGDRQLRVTGATADQVGEAARVQGVTLFELTPTTRTLEDAFLGLTDEGDTYV